MSGEVAAQTRGGSCVRDEGKRSQRPFPLGKQLAEWACAGCSGDTEGIEPLLSSGPCHPLGRTKRFQGGWATTMGPGDTAMLVGGAGSYSGIGRRVSFLICGTWGTWYLK